MQFQHIMRLPEISEFLHLPERDVVELVKHEGLPAHMVGGEWRFHKDEVFRWLGHHHLPGISEERWRDIERGQARRQASGPKDTVVSSCIPGGAIAVLLPSKTRASVVRDIVKLAEATGLLYDPANVSQAIIEREKQGSTAIAGGIAFPHPHEPVPYAVEDTLVTVAVTARGVPFGAPDGGLTDVFFTVVASDISAHLHVLARLSRMLLESDLADTLRECASATEARTAIEQTEQAVASTL